MSKIYSFMDRCTNGVLVSDEIGSLLSINHEVCLKSLSLLFSAPAFFGDYVPAPVWKDISYVKGTHDTECAPRLYGKRDARELHVAFEQSVDASIGVARTVAVALSGGIDSAAILCAAHDIARKRDIRLIAVTTEQISDAGLSNKNTAEAICKAVSPSIEFILNSGRSMPRWDVRGPCLHALPWSTSHQVELMHQAGAEVLLTGSGSDELVGASRYLSSHLSLPGFIKYLTTVLENGWYGAIAESACLMANTLANKNKVKFYMACNYIATRDICPSKVLSKSARFYVEQWEAAYMRSLFDRHCRAAVTWAELDAFDTLYPLQLPTPSNATIPTEAPFLAEPFFGKALDVSLTARFNPRNKDSYRRRKTIAADLVRPDVLAFVPNKKATFRKSIANQQFPYTPSSLMVVETGLIDPDEMCALDNAEIVPTIFAVEQWLQGARGRGFKVGRI